MNTVVASTAALCCCLILACSDAGQDIGPFSAGGATSVSGSGGALTSAGNTAGGASSGVPGVSGSTSTAGGSSGGASSGGNGASTAGSGGSGGAALPTDGPGLYAANCAMCHGEQGRGAMNGPDIMHPIRDYSTWVVRNGRAQTPYPKPMEKRSPEQLSDAQLSLIFDYLDTPPQPATGAGLYADYCVNCHGSDGKSGPVMKDTTMELDELEQQVRQGAHPGEYEMREEFMPVFTMMRLSDADLDLIYDYVDSL
jgi:mono/diheme cytochrome c family protein